MVPPSVLLICQKCGESPLAASHFQYLLALNEQPSFLSAHPWFLSYFGCSEVRVGLRWDSSHWRIAICACAGASSWCQCILIKAFGQEVLGSSLDGFQAIDHNILIICHACALILNLEKEEFRIKWYYSVKRSYPWQSLARECLGSLRAGFY
jgi:hypothetical protein